MNLDELEFKAIDFQGLGVKLGADLTPFAERANRLLRERLEKAPTIFLGVAFPEDSLSACREAKSTHTARLVCVEEIK